MRVVVAVLVAATMFAAPPLAWAADRSARKPYPCNPQQECLARAAGLKGAAAEAAKRDCRRMPTTGTCFGPADTPADRSDRSKKP